MQTYILVLYAKYFVICLLYKIKYSNVHGPHDIMICLDDFEKSAKEKLESGEFQFYAAGDEDTLRDCREAFNRYRLRPRILRNVSNRDLRTTLLGQPVAMPIGISPTALQRLAHMEKEIGTAIAAAKAGVVMGLSMHATSTIEDIAAAAPSGTHWMQIQFMKNPRIAETAVRKAEAAGFKALTVTCDMPVSVVGKRTLSQIYMHPRNIMVHLDLPDDEEVAEYKANGDCMLNQYCFNQFMSPTWEDVRKLGQRTKLPLVAKGITTGTGAIEAVENGVDAIFVSVHGGRLLSGVRAPIDALAEVVKAVKHTGVEVYLDGGVRKGSDVFKALALGAKAVFLGRPVLWGLAHDGSEGVSQVLNIIRDEFSTTMALMGCSSIRDIQPSMVVHESEYLTAKL